MNATLFMTDSWQPTVLRLVPFSNNNARTSEQPLHLEKSRSERSNPTVHRRSFPVLAVTRAKGSGQSDHRSLSNRSVTSAKSDTSDHDNESVVSDTAVRPSGETDMAIKPDGDQSARGTDRMGGVRTPSEKDSMKFSIQNLNEQLSSSSSLKSSDATEFRAKDKNVALDNTRTRFPKPSLANSNDNKNVSPVNGVRRSVPLTPGELDLKRFRDNYTQEQAQRKKKYKLNVNQLPRSTTPINDHDPDKLNMKQVIAFLQTKASRDLPKRSATDRSSSSPRAYRRSFELAVTASKRSVMIVDERSPSQQSKLSSREGSRKAGTVSVMSTKSTPNFPFSQSSGVDHHDHRKSSMSMRSTVGRNRTKRSGSYKPVKEFRLYRFLAVAPTGKNPTGLTTAITDAGESGFKEADNAPPMAVRGSQSNRNVRKTDSLKRNTTTANLLHRRARQKGVSADKVKDANDTEKSALIRLPNVTDFHDDPDSIHSDDETNSTTSATCNSTHMEFVPNNNNKPASPRKSRITFSDDTRPMAPDRSDNNPITTINVDTVDDNSSDVDNDVIHNKSSRTIHSTTLPGINPRMYKNPEFPRVNIQIPNYSVSQKPQLHVTVPLENKNSYSSEIVRLTLRQDKHATRVTSYMSDIEHSDSDSLEHAVAMTSLTSPHSHRDAENARKSETVRYYPNGVSHVADVNPSKQKQRIQMYSNE